MWRGGELTIDDVIGVRPLSQQQLFDVKLDDGNVVRASATSLFVMRNGDRKMAPELRPGDSLLPLYLEEDSHGYPTYRIPGKSIKRKISRFVAEWMFGRKLPRGTNVEHVDGNRKNYHPNNIRVRFSARSPKKGHKNPLITTFNETKAFLEEIAQEDPKIAEIVAKKPRRNHKVVSVTPGELGLVYGASVRSASALSVCGVFLELPS